MGGFNFSEQKLKLDSPLVRSTGGQLDNLAPDVVQVAPPKGRLGHVRVAEG
jgi:hypothetical protein